MIGCFNQNGHDCGKSDLDTVSFVPLDVLEDAEIHRGGQEALIYYPFDDEDDIDAEEADNDNEVFGFEEADDELRETIYASLLLGADYDYDDELYESPSDWIQRRYADVIRLNDELGYRRPVAQTVVFNPTFVGHSRSNVRPLHWSHKRSLRECSPTYDKRRGKAHAK